MFFFFKQKTAYEMRISDWSSDVCSSDLLRPLPRIGGAERRLGEDIVVIFVDDRALDDRRAVVQQRGNDAARVELSVFRRVMLELANVQRMPFLGETLLGQTEENLARGAGGPGMVQTQFPLRRHYDTPGICPPWSFCERPAGAPTHKRT